MITRLINNQIKKRLADKKAIILLGPRQVGKSTPMVELLQIFTKM